MSDQLRELPDQPSLRYLKLEAKRRLSAGEFATLHQAQLAIAREHGLSSWTALKARIEAVAPTSHALTQVRWVTSRFGTADTPEWTPPDEDELRRHFDDHYLGLLPPDWLSALLGTVARQLREDLADVRAEPLRLRARIADLRVEAATEPGPPYRLRTLRLYSLETKVDDPRVAAPAARASGAVPGEVSAVAADAFGELGLAGLIVAGDSGGGSVWVTARGWADLGQGEVLLPEHRFPVYSITKLVTAVVVLRLVADGRVRLDDPANAHLRTVRLADDAVTVRELLTHSGGVDNPGELFADRVPELVSVTGPVAACGGSRGTFAYGHGEYALLGQLIADVTGTGYVEAATRMVLEPLGMSDSWFPRTWPATAAVIGHRLTDEGLFEGVPAQVSAVPAVGGLWTTAADLVRFGLAWSSLLPGPLAREALRPQADRDGLGGQVGLGWMLMPPKDVAGHPGAGSGFSASLIIRPGRVGTGGGRTWVVLTNRQVAVEPLNERLVLPLT
ncbi:serine hydrolase domain-containing protein [Nonomuraea jiangxiensis]|uniref:CubicO group peptidase, beta-lactamase class C family n=1 Tax=Nonomuraea jiangxiensis TaxID=633440 RepID=A0A1G9TKT5_9ACTN|nr:serine hydrolase domain-containing protein [Nonomuraea jiangxiensis]SDM47735.1 CubicO group peptidase, beta-lactamase class C family [Nonomuraea jiangxiensis]